MGCWRGIGVDFEGKVGLEVRGRIYIPFVRLEGINKVYKRGKPFLLTWTGGTQQNILNFDLYKGDEKISPFSNIANVGQTELSIPTSVKSGKDYYFRITDSKNKDQIVNTQTFGVKRKVPLLIKAVPVALVGLTVYLLTNVNDGSSSITDPPSPTSIHN